MTRSFLLASVLLLCVVTVTYCGDDDRKDLARGWGEDIEWVTFEEGKLAARERNLPLMLLIHKTWCGACKALKSKFSISKDIQERAGKFIMVNTEDDEEPKGKEFVPDGGYIPRIFFLEPSGLVREDLFNEGGNEKFKYFYPSDSHVVEAMDRALEKIESSSQVTKDEL